MIKNFFTKLYSWLLLWLINDASFLEKDWIPVFAGAMYSLLFNHYGLREMAMKNYLKIGILSAVFLGSIGVHLVYGMQQPKQPEGRLAHMPQVNRGSSVNDVESLRESKIDNLLGKHFQLASLKECYDREDWCNFCPLALQYTDDRSQLGAAAQELIALLAGKTTAHPTLLYFFLRSKARLPIVEDVLIQKILLLKMRVTLDLLLMLHEKKESIDTLKIKYEWFNSRIYKQASHISVQQKMKNSFYDDAFTKALQWFLNMIKSPSWTHRSPVWVSFFHGWLSGYNPMDMRYGLTVDEIKSDERDFWCESTRIEKINQEYFPLYAAAIVKVLQNIRKKHGGITLNETETMKCWNEILACDLFIDSWNIVTKGLEPLDFQPIGCPSEFAIKLIERFKSLKVSEVVESSV